MSAGSLHEAASFSRARLYGARQRRGFLIGALVARHRPQHVDPAAGQAQDRLAVELPLGSLLAVVVPRGAGPAHRCLGGEVEDAA
jgi:hypothetical protein